LFLRTVDWTCLPTCHVSWSEIFWSVARLSTSLRDNLIMNTEYPLFSVPVRLRAERGKCRSRRSLSSSSSSSVAPPSPPSPPSPLPETLWNPINGPVANPLSPGALPQGESLPPKDPDDEPFFKKKALSKHLRRALLDSHKLVAAPQVDKNPRKRHLGVLTAIMHKCLLTQDWERAQRAFVMVIRQKDVDLRSIWAVGVEILLAIGKKDPEIGITRAVEFLERLVLLFPYNPYIHSRHPWLVNLRRGREEESERNRKRKQIKARERMDDEEQIDPGDEVEDEVEKSRPVPLHSSVEFFPVLFELLIEASRENDLNAIATGLDEEQPRGDITRPEKIKDRLDELLLAPPWSDMEALIVLRGMLCLWIADLKLERAVNNCIDEDTNYLVQNLRAEAKEQFLTVKSSEGSLPEVIGRWLVGQEQEAQKGQHGDDEEADIMRMD
jgi:hypothetical protein